MRDRFWKLAAHVLFMAWRSALDHISSDDEDYDDEDDYFYAGTPTIGRPWLKWLLRGNPKPAPPPERHFPPVEILHSDHVDEVGRIVTEGDLITEADLGKVLFPYEPGDGISGTMVADPDAPWGWSWVMTPEEAAAEHARLEKLDEAFG